MATDMFALSNLLTLPYQFPLVKHPEARLLSNTGASFRVPLGWRRALARLLVGSWQAPGRLLANSRQAPDRLLVGFPFGYPRLQESFFCEATSHPEA